LLFYYSATQRLLFNTYDQHGETGDIAKQTDRQIDNFGRGGGPLRIVSDCNGDRPRIGR